MAGFKDRLMHAWNAFVYSEQSPNYATTQNLGVASSYRPERVRPRIFNERTIIGSIYNHMAIDVAAVNIRHIRVDANGRYQADIDSNLQNCLMVEANIDQGARQFRQDIAMTLFDQGVAAIVPVDTTLNPIETGGYDVQTMRVGRVINWYPQYVTVRLYNEQKGIQEDITLPKSMVAIVENPLYTVMNEPNSTLQRLLRKLALLDDVDEQSASGKLDLIIQLPYVVKTETRRAEAKKRMQEIEFQLKGSQYGIAYTDGTEKITQLNRPAENNLMDQIQYLVTLLYSQLGITEEVMNGTALQPAMINYYNRAIEPILGAISEAMMRTFLTRTARSQGQAIMAIRDPFKLITIDQLTELAEAFTRNEIFSSNDVRSIVGWLPSTQSNADELRNKNMPIPSADPQPAIAQPDPAIPLPPKIQGRVVKAISS